MVIKPILKFELKKVTKLGSSERGEKGFGSSGKWGIIFDRKVYVCSPLIRNEDLLKLACFQFYSMILSHYQIGIMESQYRN